MCTVWRRRSEEVHPPSIPGDKMGQTTGEVFSNVSIRGGRFLSSPSELSCSSQWLVVRNVTGAIETIG